MARPRPSSPDSLLNIRGVGDKKLADIGQPFLETISNYCREQRLELDLETCQQRDTNSKWYINKKYDGRV